MVLRSEGGEEPYQLGYVTWRRVVTGGHKLRQIRDSGPLDVLHPRNYQNSCNWIQNCSRNFIYGLLFPCCRRKINCSPIFIYSNSIFYVYIIDVCSVKKTRRPSKGLDLKFHCFNHKIIYYNIVQSVGFVLYNVHYRSHDNHPMLSILSKKNPVQYLLTSSFDIHV